MEKTPNNSYSSNINSQQNKPNLCNKYKRYEQAMMVQATALIIDNIGVCLWFKLFIEGFEKYNDILFIPKFYI